MLDDTLLDRALTVDRAIDEALAPGGQDVVPDVIRGLYLLTSRLLGPRGEPAYLMLPDHDEFDGSTDWHAKIHGMIRTIRVATGRRETRVALKVVQRELEPLTGIARQREVYAD